MVVGCSKDRYYERARVATDLKEAGLAAGEVEHAVTLTDS